MININLYKGRFLEDENGVITLLHMCGLDDSMAIVMAFQTPELEILGLTTVFGNVSTQDATHNALLLVCTKHPLSVRTDFFENVLESVCDLFPFVRLCKRIV